MLEIIGFSGRDHILADNRMKISGKFQMPASRLFSSRLVGIEIAIIEFEGVQVEKQAYRREHILSGISSMKISIFDLTTRFEGRD